MADAFYDDVPALANQISNDIDQIEKSLGFIKDVLQNFLISFSNTDATVAYPANMELDSSPGSNTTAYGITFQDTCGDAAGHSFGQLVYRKSDSKLWLADADSLYSMPVVAMAIATIAQNATGRYLAFGFARNDAWNWTVADGSAASGLIYASATAGASTQTAPSGSGDQVQVIGTAWTADIMLFNPAPVLVEI